MALPALAQHQMSEVSLQIPSEEAKRQATSALRGYIYQIYQSVFAWSQLGKDETLLLEVAEDYAIVARDAIRAVQVKDTAASGSVTLKTPGVGRALDALWNFQSANPTVRVFMDYLTTSTIGREKGVVFPDAEPGLKYWRVAAREGSNLEPLRQALAELDLNQSLKGFIQTASPAELRDRLLRRVRWLCGAEDIDALLRTIQDHLVYLGEESAAAPSDSQGALDALVAKVLQLLVRDSGRELTRAEFRRVFDGAVSISMPLSTVRRMLAGSVLSASTQSIAPEPIVDVARIPLPPRSIGRSDMVGRLVASAGRYGALWLHGSSGLGKTVLCQLLARRSTLKWALVELRGSSAPEVGARLRHATLSVSARDVGGLIVDDLPLEHAAGARLSLSMLASQARTTDTVLIVTCSRPPPPTLQGCFGEAGADVHEVPYLTVEEVAELVTLAGGDQERWAPIVHAFCGSGHPQLVDARVIGLSRRGWPEAEMLAGIGTGEQPEELDEERAAVRKRLTAELSSGERELLYRLSLVAGKFDRALAIALGNIAPSIDGAGDAFDLLLGPWLESAAQDRFRVSPLVSDAGMLNLSEEQTATIRNEIVDEMLGRRPFPADFLTPLMSHALAVGHAAALAWLAGAVLSSSDAQRRSIASALFVLPLLDDFDERPFPVDEMHVSALLRFAQFRIAVANSNVERLPAIFEQLVSESRQVEEEEAAQLLGVGVLVGVLERSLRIRPRKWLSLINELEQLDSEGALGVRPPVLLEGLSMTQFAFVCRANALAGIEEMGELFEELDALDAGRRQVLLSALRAPGFSANLVVQSCWLHDHREGSIDGERAAQEFVRLGEIAGGWGSRDLEVACACARVVMLDEYAQDPDAALAAVDDALARFNGDVLLVRRKAFVYFRRNDYQAALAEFESIADSLPNADLGEKGFVFREAGICAAELGDWRLARELFDRGLGAVESGEHLVSIRAGLAGECAVASFRMKDWAKAIEYVAKALREAEELDANGAAHERYRGQILLHVILWMKSEVDGVRDETEWGVGPGVCSSLEVPAEVTERPAPHRLLSWYELAELESMLGVEGGILEELRARSETGGLVWCEFKLSHVLAESRILRGDVAGFVEHVGDFVSKRLYMLRNSEQLLAEDVRDPRVGIVPPLQSADWSDERCVGAVKDVVVSFSAIATIAGRTTQVEQVIAAAAAMKGPGPELEGVLRFLAGDDETGPISGLFEAAAWAVGRLRACAGEMDPGELFKVSYYLWNWLASGQWGWRIGHAVSEALCGMWSHVIRGQRFLLFDLSRIPDIEAAIANPKKGQSQIAQILLAAASAVRAGLDAGSRERLEKSAAPAG